MMADEYYYHAVYEKLSWWGIVYHFNHWGDEIVTDFKEVAEDEQHALDKAILFCDENELDAQFSHWKYLNKAPWVFNPYKE